MQDLQITFRLEQIINEHGITWSKLATDIGLTPQATTKWKKGQISSKTVKKIGNHLGIDLVWLLTGETNQLPINNGKDMLSDNNVSLYHHANIHTELKVDIGEYILDKFHQINRDELFIVPIIDDEMYPILKRGSLAIGDTSKSQFPLLSGYIYVIGQGNTLYCRYLEEYSDTQIRIYSEINKVGQLLDKTDFKNKYKIQGGILLSTEFYQWF